MTGKKQAKPTKANAVELDESDLDNVQGGADLDRIGNYNFKIEINGIKPRLTDVEETGLRDNLSKDGTKLRK